MTVNVEITEDGKKALASVLEPKDYSTGKKGFYARVSLILSNKIYEGNIMLYEKQNKK